MLNFSQHNHAFLMYLWEGGWIGSRSPAPQLFIWSGAHTVKFNWPPCPLGTAGQSTLKGMPFLHVGISRDEYGTGLISLWILSFCFAKPCKLYCWIRPYWSILFILPSFLRKLRQSKQTHTHPCPCSDVNKRSVTSPRNTCLSFSASCLPLFLTTTNVVSNLLPVWLEWH